MTDALHETAHRLSSLFGSPVVIEDHRFNLVAHSPHAAHVDQLRSESILHRRCDEAARRHFEAFGIATADRPVLVPASIDGQILARWCLPIRWRGVTHGYAWSIAGPVGPPAHLLADAMELTRAIGELLEDDSRRKEAQSRAAGRLLVTTDPIQAEAVLDDLDHHCGWSAEQHVAIVVVRGSSPQPPPSTLTALAAVRADLPGPDTVLLVPHDAAGHRSSLCLRVSKAFGHDTTARWSVGIGESSELSNARISWRQARTAAQVADTDDATATVVRHWAQLGVARLMAVGADVRLGDASMPTAVQLLIEHHDHDLVRTVHTYLDLAGQVQLTADRLCVHRQTLYRRLRRVEELTGLDLMVGQDRLTLHLALTLATYRRPPALQDAADRRLR